MQSLYILFLIKGVIIGSIYALISLGFNVIYNTTGVINFAQGEFVMVGGIATAWAATTLHMPIPLAILTGAAIAALVGLAVYTFAVRPARKASPVAMIIITIGISIILQSAASLIWGTDPYQLQPLKEGPVTWKGTTLPIDYQQLLIIAVAAACMLVLTLFFRITTTGRAMKACAENPDAAKLCGVSVKRMSAVAFMLSALLGGVGGIMVTPIISMSFDRGTMLGLKGFSAAILGGMGNPVGGVAGGLLIGILEQFSCYYSSVYRDTLALAIVVIILLIRPRGLLSR